VVRLFVIVCLVISGLEARPDSLLEEYSENLIDEESFPERDNPEISVQIDINNGTPGDIGRIPFLSRTQVLRMLDMRPFDSFTDLAALIGRDTLNMIRPFIDLKAHIPVFSGLFISRISGSDPKNRGILSGIYPGTPFDIYNRIDFQYRSWLSCGFLSQKDAGETDLFDHRTGYFHARFSQNKIQMILGSFRVSAGTGLILSNPYGMGGESFNVRSPSGGPIDLRPFLSAHESYGFQGIGFKLDLHDQSAILFASSKTLDPLIDPASGLIYGIRETGWHRTESELYGRDLLRESSVGGALTIEITESPQFQAGFSLLRTIYNPPIIYNMQSRGEFMIRRNYYHFSGDRITNFSLFSSIASNNIYLTGEYAASRPGKSAYQISGGSIHRNSKFGFIIWYLTPDYTAPFGRVTGTAGGFPANCKGIRFIFSSRLTSRWSLNFAWTVEKDLFRPAGSQFPGVYRQLLLQVRNRPQQLITVIIRYQHTRTTSGPCLQKMRISLENRVSRDLRLRSRIAFSSDQNWRGKVGFTMFEDLEWQFFRFLRITSRISFFHTWNYGLRLYEFENDVPGVLRTVPNYGSGSKWYFILRFDPLLKTSLWLKIKKLILDDVPSIGSGNDLTDGNVKMEYRIQIQYQF